MNTCNSYGIDSRVNLSSDSIIASSERKMRLLATLDEFLLGEYFASYLYSSEFFLDYELLEMPF
jgi:hypothetical protein